MWTDRLHRTLMGTWDWLTRPRRRSVETQEASRSVVSRARFWSELREGQRDAEARVHRQTREKAPE